jgi:hypothetical protein
VTGSELAFLALGLLLGAATGAALLVVLGDHPRHREIRVTVARDAVPRRSETLSQDAFITSPSEPARGGPGDRRWFDRGDGQPESDPHGWVPVTTTATVANRAPIRPPDRTIVPSVGRAMGSAVGIAIEPEADPELEDLRRHRTQGSALERMLRGEHRAMVEVVDAVAGADSHRRRDWEVLLGGLVEAMADMAVRESVIDFPMGTAFWDTFTVEQCRRVVAALASMGYRYDGNAGWVDSRAPAYRDLTKALADVGVEPRRVRAWPNQSDIAALFAGARPAPEELIAAAGPDYSAADMQALLGEHAAELDDLWLAWDAVRPLLFADVNRIEARAEA